jgi:hypothetical protein
MSRTNREPEYRLRIREKAEKDKNESEKKRQKAQTESHTSNITAAIHRIKEALERASDEETPQKKRERYWERAGIVGLWAAAAVGVAAIWIGSSDSSKQRGVMQGQLTAMQSDRPTNGRYYQRFEDTGRDYARPTGR